MKNLINNRYVQISFHWHPRDNILTPTISHLITVSLTSLLTPTLSHLVQNPFLVHKLTREQHTMAITKNLVLNLKCTINNHQILSPSNDFLQQNQQDQSNSFSSNIRPSNKGNQSYCFRPSNHSNLTSISAVVEPVIDTEEEDKYVKEKEKEIKVKEEIKRE